MMQMTGTESRRVAPAGPNLAPAGKDKGGAGAVQARPGRRARLSRDLVLDTALALVDQEGLEGLSMRRLASKLGVEAMAIYRHAANKQELLGGIIDRVLSELRVDSRDCDDWQEWLRSWARDFRRVVLAHPNVFPLLVTRPLSIPLSQRPPAVLAQLEAMLTVLEKAGFCPQEALRAQQTFSGYLLGHLLIELRQVIEDPEEPEPALRLGLYRLPARQFPRLRKAAVLLVDQDADAAFETGLGTILDGLRRQAGAGAEGAGAGGRAGEPHAVTPRAKAKQEPA